MKCPKCGQDEAYLTLHEIIDGNSRLAQFFYVGLVLLECPCGHRRFNQLHFTVPYFSKTEFVLSREGLKIIELGGRMKI